MRMRKKKHGAERMQACDDIWIREPSEHLGKWRALAQESFEVDAETAQDIKLCLEIGCGKGTFVCEMAKRHPECFFVAVEKVPDVVLLAMEKAKTAELSNVVFVNGDASTLTEAFAEGELDEIYLNFSDPWPKKGHAKRRLTHRNFLAVYNKILSDNGALFFKTDNRPLFDFSLEEMTEFGLKLSDITFDLHNSPYEADNIHTEYENTFSARGYTINRVVARKK